MAYGGAGTKGIAKRYPVTSGTGADDKHVGRKLNLVPRGYLGVKTTCNKRDNVGL